MKISRLLLVAVCVLAIAEIGGACLSGQVPPTYPLKSHEINLNVASGTIYHVGDSTELVWSEDLTVQHARWLRLRFSHLVLAGSPMGGESSILRITSLADGSYQTLDAATARQWRNTSAYFNGNSVRLELFAVPNGRLNLVTISGATVGEPDGVVVTNSICDSVDDRVLSNDPRVGRTAPGGCTGWLFNDRNHCMLTAGHCAATNEVMLFNVPLSDSNGNRQFPGPEDQYAVDFDSRQIANSGIGNDWCYFGCFPNSVTGLTPFQAQGTSLQLAIPMPVQPGDMIRITGYGSTSFPVSPTWNGAQKTQVGPFMFFSTNSLGYRTDTTGGNSGSPIIFESTGEAIGIHTHGGCSNNGNGMNQGTSLLQPGLMNALQNPLGICELTILFEFPDGLPTMVDPDGGTTVLVSIDDQDLEIVPQSVSLHVNSGAGFQKFGMKPLGQNLFRGTFPAVECGRIVGFFVSVDTVSGSEFSSPMDAPVSFYSAVGTADQGTSLFADDFETDMGWTVFGSATTGMWERGIPAGGGDRGDPPTDADGSGACYVTGLADGNNDVDGGFTTLVSPIIDATTTDQQTAVLSYYRWFFNQFEDDALIVEISNNGGNSWQVLEIVGPTGPDINGGWVLKMFVLEDVITPTNQMRLRVTASDTGQTSIVEAGLDGVQIRFFDCEDSQILLGDVNRDGVVNLKDIQPFVDLINAQLFQAEADINGDGQVNLKDVQPFVLLLIGG